MKPFQHLFLLTLSLTLILSSCTMEKRVYLSGYNIDWHHSKHNQDKSPLVNRDNKNRTEQNQQQSVGQSENKTNAVAKAPPAYGEHISASADNSFLPVNVTTSRQKNFSTKDSTQVCDNIVLRNGEEIKAKITEITGDEIKYKRCDNLTGPTYLVKKSEVFMIKYPNGTKDVINQNNSTQTNSSQKHSAPSHNDNAGKKMLGLAVAGFIIALVGIFIPTLGLALLCEILAIVFGAVSLAKINNHPNDYKGKGFAIASIIIGLVSLALILLVIALLM